MTIFPWEKDVKEKRIAFRVTLPQYANEEVMGTTCMLPRK